MMSGGALVAATVDPATAVADATAKWGKVIRAAGIKAA
jgi:hypothetical protein